jgi:hypothetical protein
MLFCHKKKVLGAQNTLAQNEMESPEPEQLIFLDRKERPTEAPFMFRKIVALARS